MKLLLSSYQVVPRNSKFAFADHVVFVESLSKVRYLHWIHLWHAKLRFPSSHVSNLFSPPDTLSHPLSSPFYGAFEVHLSVLHFHFPADGTRHLLLLNHLLIFCASLKQHCRCMFCRELNGSCAKPVVGEREKIAKGSLEKRKLLFTQCEAGCLFF